MQLVIAAITTAPCRSSPLSPRTSTGAERERSPSPEAEAPLLDRRGQGLAEGVLHLRRGLRGPGAASGPARLGSTEPRSSSSVSVKTGSGVALGAEETLLLAVALDEVDLGAWSVPSAQVARASRRPRGRSRRSRRTRGPCSRSWRGPRASSGRGRGRRTPRTSRPRPSCGACWVTVRTRSVAVTPSRRLAREAEAHDLGGHHVEGLAEHGRLRLDPAHSPAEDAEAVDHRGVGVRAHERVREGHGLPERGRR